MIPPLEQLPALRWHRLQCELITPLYGGGVEAATVDLKMPIRANEIRGQLRFWWRLLAKNKWNLTNPKYLQQAEFALWGGQGDEKGGRASQVLIKVSQPSVNLHDLMKWQDIRLPYVMFPASNETNTNISHDLLKTDKLKFQLDLAFSPVLELDQTRQNQVIETLQWWANFGGLGARTRRGLGAVHVAQCEDFPNICKPLTIEEVGQANCKLVIKGKSANALTQLQNGIQKLSDFRQKAEIGRNKGTAPKPAGRSRWPEPDALRKIHHTHHPHHEPEHKAGTIFPRALFGLPIIFHFVGAKEPPQSQLIPVSGDRLASPLIIRPYYLGTTNKEGDKEWAAAALVLPYEHIKNMQVSIGNNKSYPIWTSDTAQKIKPIQDNKGLDPLDAFFNYFDK